MTNNTIYLKSGDAFVIMWEDSVEIVQPDGNSIITRRLVGNKSVISLIKRTPEEVAEIAERCEKARPAVKKMISVDEYLKVTPFCAVPKFHGVDGDYMAEAWELELGQKVMRINEGQ